jgi:hypothetical protein
MKEDFGVTVDESKPQEKLQVADIFKALDSSRFV